ncbi:aspartate carbamoyltransferase catalytic subunit [soil metagenome]
MLTKINSSVSKLVEALDGVAEAQAWRERRHLVDTRQLTLDEVSACLALAHYYKQNLLHKKPPLTILSAHTIATVFYENSTRTRTSFDLAARKLGATVVNLDVNTSSAAKGETLEDTALNLWALGVNGIIMRHSQSGAPDDLVRQVGDKMHIVNAGDGWHAHPSQGLLDLYTMLESLGQLPSFGPSGKIEQRLNESTLAGKKVAIVGDIIHSRVARSNLWLLKKLGAEVHLAGPPALLPQTFADDEFGAVVHHRLEPAIKNADFIICLRLQLERQAQGLIASIDEYRKQYRLDHDRIRLAQSHVRVLHPGPINRGVEITNELVEDPIISCVLTQVENGLLCRMAILTLLFSTAKPQA